VASFGARPDRGAADPLPGKKAKLSLGAIEGHAAQFLSWPNPAGRWGKPQSFVAKYESGERRVDVAEFITIARAIGENPARLFPSIAKKLPSTSS
jgi:hypothetical protein